jgi:hypothetical protein
MIVPATSHRGAERDGVARWTRAGIAGLAAALAMAVPAFAPATAQPPLAASLEGAALAVSDDGRLPGEGRPPSPGPTSPD